MQQSATEINRYANAMFSVEHLHDGWLDRCADYLRHVFGDALSGARVIDYGFGRGNWGLAFLRAGAGQVLAIDAAADNVRRLNDYVRQNDISGIDIVHGNLLSKPIEAEVDIVWLYGVLPCVDRPVDLLRSLGAMAPRPEALFYVYGYDAGSLRQFTVSTARRWYGPPAARDFNRDAMSLTRAARMRARDDLTAPLAEWFDADGFSRMLEQAGLAPIARHQGFPHFLHGRVDAEFQPHEALCRWATQASAMEWKEPLRDYGHDLEVLSALAAAVDRELTGPEVRRWAAMGLMNAHFAHLGNGPGCATAIEEIFLYLLHLLQANGAIDRLDGLAREFAELAFAAMADAPRRDLPAAAHPSRLARFLQASTIRL